MSKAKIILIGGGGHCKSCIEIIEAEKKYIIAGILDVKEKIGQEILGYKIIGSDEDIDILAKEGYWFLITLGQIKNATIRKQIFDQLKLIRANMATVISPHAIISNYSSIGEGTIIMHGVIVNANSTIGANCILNTSCIIEHDTTIGMNCHISTNVAINGACTINDEVFVGSGAVIINNIQVHSSVVIGAGVTVYKNINLSGIFVGNK